MKRRGFARRVIRRPGGQNLIWITSVTAVNVLEGNTVAQNLLLPSDWLSAGVSGFDRATVMRIRGWLSFCQTAVATNAAATGFYAAIHLQDTGVAGASSPFAQVFYEDHDTIWTGGCALTSAAASTTQQVYHQLNQLDVKVKRRITTQQDVNLTVGIPPDAGTPSVAINGVIRLLLKTD